MEFFGYAFPREKKTDSCFYICVVYLPPENYARSINIHEFLDSFTSDIYAIPNGSPFYICGDWNSRVADIPDFITGIDFLPERQVVDFTHNKYGDILSDFLSNVNSCILNEGTLYIAILLTFQQEGRQSSTIALYLMRN